MRIDDSIMQAGIDMRRPILEAVLQRFGTADVLTEIAKLTRTEEDEERFKILTLSDVETEHIEWLWFGYFPFGGITIVQGDPGIGKGTITLDIAARLSRGGPMPNSELETDPADTILLTVAEDDLRATIKPRLVAAGADCSRIHAFENLLDLPDDIDRIRQAIEERKAKYVIVDPLNAYLSARVDSHKDQDIRKAMSPLKILAEQTGASIVLVHHLNKAPGTTAMYRGGGSIGIVGAARCVLLVAEHPKIAGQRVLARVKGNLSALPPALAYTLEDVPQHHTASVHWHGVAEFTADQLLNPPKEDQQPGAAVLIAVEFYKEVLADGRELPSTELDQLLKDAGISIRSAQRARKEIGVRSRKVGFGKDSTWMVRLPSSEDRHPNNTNGPDTDNAADFDDLGGLWKDSDEDRQQDPKTATEQEFANVAENAERLECNDDAATLEDDGLDDPEVKI